VRAKIIKNWRIINIERFKYQKILNDINRH
jgi:hypothetical protein